MARWQRMSWDYNWGTILRLTVGTPKPPYLAGSQPWKSDRGIAWILLDLMVWLGFDWISCSWWNLMQQTMIRNIWSIGFILRFSLLHTPKIVCFWTYKGCLLASALSDFALGRPCQAGFLVEGKLYVGCIIFPCDFNVYHPPIFCSFVPLLIPIKTKNNKLC